MCKSWNTISGICNLTSAIVVAHIGGEPMDIEGIMAIAKKHNLPVVEDCSQSHAAKINGKFVGSFGDVSAFSIMFGKHFCCGGQGGMVFTKDPDIYRAVRNSSDRGKPYEESLKRSSEELAWRAEEANKMGVVYAVEAHMWSIAPDPYSAQKLLDMTPGLTLTLDYGHYTAQGFADSEIENLLEKSSHFHARCAAQGKLQTDFAKNTINWERVVEKMNYFQYNGYMGIEYVFMDDKLIEIVDILSQTVILRDVLRNNIKLQQRKIK